VPLAVFKKTKKQNAVQSRSAGHGTPSLLTFLKILGAFPSRARPYRVRDPMYRSELAAESTNTRIALNKENGLRRDSRNEIKTHALMT
jgi:hypothetical protein